MPPALRVETLSVGDALAQIFKDEGREGGWRNKEQMKQASSIEQDELERAAELVMCKCLRGYVQPREREKEAARAKDEEQRKQIKQTMGPFNTLIKQRERSGEKQTVRHEVWVMVGGRRSVSSIHDADSVRIGQFSCCPPADVLLLPVPHMKDKERCLRKDSGTRQGVRMLASLGVRTCSRQHKSLPVRTGQASDRAAKRRR